MCEFESSCVVHKRIAKDLQTASHTPDGFTPIITIVSEGTWFIPEAPYLLVRRREFDEMPSEAARARLGKLVISGSAGQGAGISSSWSSYL